MTRRRRLGEKTPPRTLVLADRKAFRVARDRLPPSDKDYPAFLPHITVGYGIGDDALAWSTPDNEVVFDHIVVGQGNDDWTVYMLGDIPLDGLDDVNPDDEEIPDSDEVDPKDQAPPPNATQQMTTRRGLRASAWAA